MRILVVGMPGAGNLGDDLISVLLAAHLLDRWPGAEIGILHSGISNPFPYPSQSQIVFLRTPTRRSLREYARNVLSIKKFVRKCDLILIGGGGLFQDSHYPFTVHEWLRDALRTSPYRIPVAGLGIGFGPLNLSFSRWYLRRALGRFSVIQVRDRQSAEIVRSLGHEAIIGPDIVAGTELSDTLFGVRHGQVKDPILGCSIRPWPGLDLAAVEHLIRSASQFAHAPVRLFVLEHAEPHNTSEYDFACRLAQALGENGISTEVSCYLKQPFEEFAQAFSSVTIAIASRFHANILWQKRSIPVLPIAYAPKVARLYEERGGQVLGINDIATSDDSPVFQSIQINDSFCLPKNELLLADRPYRAGVLRTLGQAIGAAETAYDLGRRLSRRLK